MPTANDVTPVTYRPLTPSDVGEARRLWLATPNLDLSSGDSPEELVRYLERNPGTSQGAFVDGVMVGAVLAGHDGHRGLLYHLAVATTHQRSGIGGTLVDRGLSALNAAGIGRVLILVFKENESGSAFWARQGFEAMPHVSAMRISF